ncbi:hypothetical protein, partial [Escherichia coli]|uniref:hypothetical protein n=1 Tax=Escherichia coli TaxID=562 RepID=UPI00201018B9
DFAQYLLQTRNIVDGRAQADNGLVFAGTGEHYAVSAYPVGFPLMLAPIYLAAGLQVRPYFFFLSALLLLSGLLMYLYYWKQLPPYLAVLLPL